MKEPANWISSITLRRGRKALGLSIRQVDAALGGGSRYRRFEYTGISGTLSRWDFVMLGAMLVDHTTVIR